MLSIVLGSSSHAFEIMLGTFILGLALGGLWVKGRIDKIETLSLFWVGSNGSWVSQPSQRSSCITVHLM